MQTYETKDGDYTRRDGNTNFGPDFFEKPIVIPRNPFWNVFRRFGRDELIAFMINLVGTTAVSFFVSSAFLLSIAGPIIEKIGFFPAHFYEALTTYNTVPLNQRKSLRIYLWNAFKGGALSLLEDICIHDPVYVMLFVLLATYPGIPIWLIVSFSFVAAVVVVAILEVSSVEIRYLVFKRKLKKAGFECESFLESRFFVKATFNSEELIQKFVSAFDGLKIVEDRTYNDLYFENQFPRFSGRIPALRLRQRTLGVSDQRWLLRYDWIKKHQISEGVQLVYTRPAEAAQSSLNQFRFFPVQKEKFYFMLNQSGMPQKIDEIENRSIRKVLDSKTGKLIKRVCFRRIVLTGENCPLLIAFDVFSQKDFYIIEIKSWKKDITFLITAMRFVMSELPVIQTTRAKLEMNF